MSRQAGPSSLDRRDRIDRMRSRAWVLQILYLWETQGCEEPLSEAMEAVFRTRRVASDRVPLVARHMAALEEYLGQIDSAIRGSVENWRLDRLSRVDRSILRLAVAELLFLREEVPPKVAIQEGIRLAGQYGGADSPRFVNGVLDAVYKTHADHGERP